MLHAGLDLSRKRLDGCLLFERGEHLDQLASPPDVDSLRTLAPRVDEIHAEPVAAVVESMTGARLLHEPLEREAGTRWRSRCSATAIRCRRSEPATPTAALERPGDRPGAGV